MSTQTGSISFEATGGFNSYAKQNYATLSQIKGQFATCGTGASTAAKVATIVPADSGWTLYDGTTVTVKFTSKNTTTAPTLNVNGTGAKPIKDFNGNDLDSDAYSWPEGAAMSFTYDGTSWRLQDSDLMERVHNAETSIEQNATNIALNASKLETVANPNLSPFFNINTVYKSSDGSGYWQEFQKFYSLLDDGWAHVSSEGLSGTYFTQHVHRAIFSSFEAGTYTLLTEFRNIEAIGNITYTVLSWAASMVPPSAQPEGFARTTVLTEASDSLIMRTTLTCNPEYSTDTRGLGFTFEGITSGESISADIRLSLYKGEYTGPWKPYSGELLYASQAELKIANDNISSKVSTTDYNGATVTSLINQSADSVKIAANHIEIDGTATFKNSNNTTTTLGDYLTNNYDAKGAANTANAMEQTLYYASNSTTAPAIPAAQITMNSASTYGAWNLALPTYSATYPYLYICLQRKTIGGTYSWTGAMQSSYAAWTSAINTTANNAAPKNSAISHTQRIYYRTNTALSGSITGPETWINESDNKYNTSAPTTAITGWSTKPTPLAASTAANATKYLYLYTCTQTQTVLQAANNDTTCTASTVLLDDTTTVIDGGKIITGSVTANAIKADSGTFNTANIPNLSAAKITSGDIAADRIKTNVVNAINATVNQIDAKNIKASELQIGQSQVTNLTNDIADAKKHTQVIVSASNVNYTANTCTLTARLYIDGELQTGTSLRWQWYRDGAAQGSQMTGATGMLNVTSTLGIGHRYSCKCTF